MEGEQGPDEGDAIRAMLLYAFLPFWFVPGLVDYAFHRKTKIETTSGTRESFMHVLMMASVGGPVALALLCEIDSAVLASAIGGALVHEILDVYDVAYANSRRETPPNEQHMHAFLEVMPIAGAFMLIGSHPEAARSLGRNPLAAFSAGFRWKRRPLSKKYLLRFFSAVLAFIVIPYTEEFVRCFRVNPSLRSLPQ